MYHQYYGSSPLARGTPERKPQNGARPRLIPARAGNTALLSHGTRREPAHPRSRGEHKTWGLVFTYSCGSSPLARGTRSPTSPTRSGTRLIPARAGNTIQTVGVILTGAAHPRSRGEHYLRLPCRRRRSGSSPLARGTQTVYVSLLVAMRLIPARAGNTRRH